MLSIIRRNIYAGIDISGVFITPATVISSNDGITTVEDLRGNLYSYYGETQNETEQVIIIEMEENQMKVIILTNGNSAIVKTVENVDIEKIKTEYPGWEISTPTSETGEIKLEAKAYGYDYSFAEIKVVG